jgi:hypothetical protein
VYLKGGALNPYEHKAERSEKFQYFSSKLNFLKTALYVPIENVRNETVVKILDNK